MTLSETQILPRPDPPYGNYLETYQNSKLLAYHESIDWVAKNTPHYDLINIMPSFVLGANEVVTQAKDAMKGTNGLLLGPLLGNSHPIPMSFSTVHVNDVADAHVNALRPEVEGNQAFLVSSDLKGLQWDDAISITRHNFPEIEQKGILPLGGTQPSLPVPVDTTKAKTKLGITFKSYEEQVNSVVGHYLTLVGGK